MLFRSPVDSNTADWVISNCVVNLSPEKPRVFAEIARVLKPGGRLVLANMTMGERLGSGIYQRLYKFSPSLMGGCRGVRMSGALQKGGFEVLSRKSVVFVRLGEVRSQGWA